MTLDYGWEYKDTGRIVQCSCGNPDCLAIKKVPTVIKELHKTLTYEEKQMLYIFTQQEVCDYDLMIQYNTNVVVNDPTSFVEVMKCSNPFQNLRYNYILMMRRSIQHKYKVLLQEQVNMKNMLQMRFETRLKERIVILYSQQEYEGKNTKVDKHRSYNAFQSSASVIAKAKKELELVDIRPVFDPHDQTVDDTIGIITKVKCQKIKRKLKKQYDRINKKTLQKEKKREQQIGSDAEENDEDEDETEDIDAINDDGDGDDKGSLYNYDGNGSHLKKKYVMVANMLVMINTFRSRQGESELSVELNTGNLQSARDIIQSYLINKDFVIDVLRRIRIPPSFLKQYKLTTVKKLMSDYAGDKTVHSGKKRNDKPIWTTQKKKKGGGGSTTTTKSGKESKGKKY